MADQSSTGDVTSQASDRRSSVRVRSLLPCSVQPLAPEDIPALEARILDIAVVESDSILHDLADWSDRADDLSRDMVFVLNEIRALRQQLAEMQRLVERQNKDCLRPEWIELNDQGLWVPRREGQQWTVGAFAEIRIQIPSIHTPDILALGEVVRVDVDGERSGEAYRFRAISQLHKRAISRYALRRERQLARSVRFSFDF